MPTPYHDALNRMFRDRPAAIVEILHDLLGVDVPVDALVRVESNDFNDRPSTDFQPDTVITVGPPQRPVHGVIVEVQREKTASKRRQLARYAAQLWLMVKCRVTVLCICPDEEVAAYYAEPFPTTLPGYVLQTVVLGPGRVPVITEPEEVRVHPELAAMSVMVHGDDHRPVAEAFVEGAQSFKDGDAPKFLEYAYSMSGRATRRLLEEIMSKTDWPVYSPFAREHFGRGEEKGLEKGRAEGEAHAVLRVLAARKIEVPDDARDRITGCSDAKQLDLWLDRAVVATCVADLFD
ncbi:hypothetical protein ACRYCC_03970 [Actinomadura scrupuli]|uniref:hypothetical protein n=1 Tax=Actinomadura scrupuli TaxID=559629 RepID=UPI003D97B3E2